MRCARSCRFSCALDMPAAAGRSGGEGSGESGSAMSKGEWCELCRCCFSRCLESSIARISMEESAATATQCAAHSMQRTFTTKARSRTRENGDGPCGVRESGRPSSLPPPPPPPPPPPALSCLQFAELVASEYKEQLHVVEEEVDLRAQRQSQGRRRRRQEEEEEEAHTAQIKCATNDTGSHMKPTPGGRARDGCCSALNSLGGGNIRGLGFSS